MRESLKERWALGEPLNEREHALAMVYGDIIDLKWSSDDDVNTPSVATFYGLEEMEDDDDAE